MDCCGQKRRNWQRSQALYHGPDPARQNPAVHHPVRLKYRGSETIMVKGIQSGFLYIFAPGEHGLEVDGRDVEQLLAGPGEFSKSK
jgi:hypothetical protein